MAPKTTTARFDVTIRSAPVTAGGGDIPGFLDMLRYEGGQVVSWNASDERNTYTVTIDVTPAFRHQPDRWRSFGVVPTETVLR